MNIRIYSYKKSYERISEYIRIKKSYERISEYICIKNDTNEYSYRKIFEYIRISEYSSHPDR